MKNSSAPPAVSSVSKTSRMPVYFCILLAVLLAGSWLFFAQHLHPDASGQQQRTESDRVFLCGPGPWGELECTRIAVELPDHFITEETLNVQRTSWVFRNYSREDTLKLFRSAQLSPRQMQLALEKSEWIKLDVGTKVVPDEELVLSLRPEERQKIYSVLEIFPDNEFYYVAFVFRKDRLKERFEYSGLRTETVQLFNQLLYPRDENTVVFADSETLMRRIPDNEEKIRLIKTLSRRSSLLVKLQITPETDMDQMLSYWGQGGRAKDLKPLLESLAKVPGGCKIDIAHLLPPFARQRVYTYPFPTDSLEVKENCHWTALNFFNSNPDPEFLKAAVVEKVVEENYLPVTDGWRMGDVVFLVNSESQLVHSAVYIADDIVFTKNGVNPSHPWIYMKMEDMLLYYETPDKPLEKWVYRHKDFVETAPGN